MISNLEAIVFFSIYSHILQKVLDKLGQKMFMYSEKATKFCEISTNYLTGST